MLVVLPLAISVAALAAGNEPPKPFQRHALVASGGISLGAYEAGASYIILKYLRANGKKKDGAPVFPVDRALLPDVTMPVVTGTSAGNINVFLAALSWFQDDGVPFSADDNLFWDVWINLGLDKLLPQDPSPDAYAKLFRTPSAEVEGIFGMQRSPRGLPEGDTVYGDEDGLLTQAAFLVANDHVRSRLKLARYQARRGDEMSLAVTLTRADKPQDDCQHVEEGVPRYVAPFMLRIVPERAPAPGANAPEPAVGWLKPFNLPQPSAVVGNVLGFPVLSSGRKVCDPRGTMPVEPDRLFETLEASAAFPVAFAPRWLEFCLPPPAPQASPPPSCLQPQRARFSDGGLFDNVPLGAAIDLAGPNGKNDTRFIYVLPDLRREPFDPIPAPPLKRGLSALAEVTGNYLNEARSYELQGISRYARTSMGELMIVDRFFPVVGEYAGAFGAFVRPEYRIYDYVIGLYDGLHAIATLQLHDDPECHARPLTDKDCYGKMSVYFTQAVDGLIGDEEIRAARFSSVPHADALPLQAFLHDLFAYETHWTTSLGQDDLHGLQIHSEPEDRFHDNPVRRIYLELRALDAQGRTLEEAGFAAERARNAEDRGSLTYFMSQLPSELQPVESGAFSAQEQFWPWQYGHEAWIPPPRPLRFGLEEWTASTIQRVLRRASDIEKLDELTFAPDPAKPQPTTIPRWVFSVGQMISASAIERGPDVYDFGSGTVLRLAGPNHLGERIIYGALIPQYLMKELAGCSAEAGWDLRLRIPELGWLVGANLGLELNLCAPPKTPFFGGRLGAGLGYDPRGRVIDDVQLGAVYHRACFPWAPRDAPPDSPGTGERWSCESVGLEASVTLLTKVRLAAGWRELRWPGPGEAPFRGPYVSLGAADLGALGWLIHEFVVDRPAEAAR